MAEKTNGKGSIYQLDKGKDGKKPKSKCRKWRLVVSLGKDPHTGKYRQKAKNFNGSYTQAQRELREFVAQIEGGNLVKQNGWTFNGYAKHYVDTRVAAGEIQERTANSLRGTLKALGYRIGELRLQEITPEVIEAAYIDLRAAEPVRQAAFGPHALQHQPQRVPHVPERQGEGHRGREPAREGAHAQEGHQREGVAVRHPRTAP